MEKIIVFSLKKIITVYQYIIRPLLGNNCRFYPVCSDYTKEALDCHGFLTGCFLSIKRILRCHPGCSGGVDTVPEK